jgi:uncharacterized iron-regulated membrane protein
MPDVRPTTPAAPPWLSTRLYAKLWRLHFYAGMLTAPLVVWLCVTGILYIIAPQVEPALYRHLYDVPSGPATTTFDAQLDAARVAFPRLVAVQFTPSKGPGRTSQVAMTTADEARMSGMRHGGPSERITVYVNPHTAQVVGTLRDEERYSRSMAQWHGNLYLGTTGRVLADLGTTWTLAMVLTGLYLWLPRRPREVWGVWLTRVKGWQGRLWWRDFHAVFGMYTSLLLAAFLVTALMITISTGAGFTLLRSALGQNVPMAPRTLASARDGDARRVSLQTLGALADRDVRSANYAISLPKSPAGLFTVSASNGMGSPTLRQDLMVDQYSGRVVHESGWADYPWLLKLTVIGLGFHFGALFGLVGELLGIVACLAAIFFVVSGLVMWWKRRPAFAWGVPKAVAGQMWAPFPTGLVVATAVFSVLLPTFGVTLVVALAVDAIVLRWMGRRRHAASGDPTLATGVASR